MNSDHSSVPIAKENQKILGKLLIKLYKNTIKAAFQCQ